MGDTLFESREGRRSVDPSDNKSDDPKGVSRDRDMRGGPPPFRCYNCNQPGHLARDCPEKPRNPLYADTRGTKISDLKTRGERYHPYDRHEERERYDSRRGGGAPPGYFPSNRGGGAPPPRYREPGSPRRMDMYYPYGGRPRSPEPRGRSPPRDYRERYPKDYRPPDGGIRRMDYPVGMERRPPEPYYRGSSPGRYGGRDFGGRGRSPPPYERDRDYRGPPPSMDYHSRSPIRGASDYKGDVGQHYRPRTPERFQNDYHDRRGPSDHIRDKSPERTGYPPSSYPPRSPQSFNRGRGGYDNYPPREDRFPRTGPPRGGDPRLDSTRDPRMDRDPRAERSDSRMDGGRGDSKVERTEERSDSFTGGQSIPSEKQRVHTP